MPFVSVLLVLFAGVVQDRSAVPTREPADAGRVETRHLIATTTAAPIPVPADGRVRLSVEVTPRATMHVYAPQETRYLPVSLRLAKDGRIKAGPPVFPDPERFYFAPLDETQLVYSRPFRIELPVTVQRGARGEPLTLRGTLRYQACDDRVCYVPTEVALTWTLAPR